MKFIPHNYQEYAIKFIEEHAETMMMLDMGLGRQNSNQYVFYPESNV